jgi:hypothetical protein
MLAGLGILSGITQSADARESTQAQQTNTRVIVHSVKLGNDDLGMRISVPEQWQATNEAFTRFHYETVLFAADNMKLGPKYQEQCSTFPDGGMMCSGTNSLSALSRQMAPGEILLNVSYFGGPPSIGGPPVDTIGSDLKTLLAAMSLSPSAEPGLSSLSMSFAKRGIRWQVSVFAKGALGETDKKNLQAMLESFRFVDAPVASEQWAAYVAWQRLPEDQRKPEVPWLLPRGTAGGNSVRVTKADSAYFVTFQRENSVWRFRVEESGTVTPIQ